MFVVVMLEAVLFVAPVKGSTEVFVTIVFVTFSMMVGGSGLITEEELVPDKS